MTAKNVIHLADWKSRKTSSRAPWRIMSEITRHKTLSVKEALEYIAFAIWHRDLPDDFDGEITCEMNEDGSIEVYAVEKTENAEEKPMN